MTQTSAQVAQNQTNGSSKNGPVGQRSNTTQKQPGGITGKGFVKGDPRINRNGRPKSFDQLRELAQTIAHAEVQTKSGDKITVADEILRSWATSSDVAKQKAFIEYAFGKVPDKIESTIDDKRSLRLHWPHERQDLAHTNGSTKRSN